MLTTTTPAAWARASAGASAFESAGRDHDRVAARSDHLLDQGDLLGEIALVPGAVDDQVVIFGVSLVVGPGALGHRLEKLVGQGLHDQGDLRPRRGFVTGHIADAAADHQRGGESQNRDGPAATHVSHRAPAYWTKDGQAECRCAGLLAGIAGNASRRGDRLPALQSTASSTDSANLASPLSAAARSAAGAFGPSAS